MRKNARGEELTAGDKAVLERAAAKDIENALDPKSFSYNLGRLLTEMPSYIVEYATTKPISTAVSGFTKATPALQKLATKSPFLAKTVGFLAGTSVQTGTGFMPRVLEKTMEYSTKTQDFAYSKEGDLLAQNLDTAKPITEIAFKNLPKGYAYTWVEVASESAGEGITYMKKGLLSRFFAKHADEGVEGTISLAKTLGWNGILEEIAEEEIANLGQAPIEGQPVNLPFATEEGTERLLLETIGIGIMGTVMQTPTNAYNKVQYNKAVKQIKTEGKKLGMSDEDINSVITELQTAQTEGVEEAVPPTEETPTAPEEEPEESKAVQNLRGQNIEVNDLNEAIENIREYMITAGGTTERTSESITPKTTLTLSQKKIGVQDLPFDENGNITLYRKGDVSVDNPNSYSIEQKAGQEAFTVNRDEILINTTSQELKDIMKQVYARKQGTRMSI